MHQKYQKQGLVIISVSLDDAEDRDSVKEAEDFLKKMKASFQNFLLEEKPEVWQKKLNAEAVPLVFVFNRQGQIEKKFMESPSHEVLEKLIEQLLRKSDKP